MSGDRPGQGRRRRASVQRGAALPRPADARARDAARDHGAARASQIGLDGARAVVVGRSDIVGKPIAHLLLQANATVTICHSHTRDLERHTLDADVLVVAAGVPGFVSPDMVKSGAAVVDVGINRTEAGLVGDVDPGAAEAPTS